MPIYICVDFDGTIVKHEYPKIGGDIPEAIKTLKDLVDKGHKLILFTMRSGKELDEAVNYLVDKGVDLHGINMNPGQRKWTSSPKAFANMYIDDMALGCPLVREKDARPYVDWKEVRKKLEDMWLL